MSAMVRQLSGGRLHCQHGPIDLIIAASGGPRDVEQAHRAVARHFPAILPRLVGELPVLRAPVGAAYPAVEGPVARRMAAAVWPHRAVFITPMAAVAGAVAEEVVSIMLGAAPGLDRAIVNNGGDIAFHLAPGRELTAGVVADVAAPAIEATIRILHDDPVRGIATSGWRGRSQSLGIADAVTVLAATAAAADAAATMIANAVDVDDPAVRRLPAREVKLDSDLGDIPVTVDVSALGSEARRQALARGTEKAKQMVLNGLIAAAFLSCQGEVSVVGDLAAARLAA